VNDLVGRLRRKGGSYEFATLCDEAADKLEQQDKEIERLQSMHVHCDHCGGSWLDDGINAGCQCRETERLQARFTAPICCICGSTRFKQAWIAENARLTGEGNIVLAVGLWGHHERQYPDEETKRQLDNLHKRKIDLCDWVWVLDIGSYIGDSTRSEIEYAKSLGKPVRYLSREFPDYVEPTDSLRAEAERLQGIVDRAYRKLSCVAIERSCKGVPEIVQACDKQAMGILSEAAEAGGK